MITSRESGWHQERISLRKGEAEIAARSIRLLLDEYWDGCRTGLAAFECREDADKARER